MFHPVSEFWLSVNSLLLDLNILFPCMVQSRVIKNIFCENMLCMLAFSFKFNLLATYKGSFLMPLFHKAVL